MAITDSDVHQTTAPGRRIQENVAEIDLPCFRQQRIHRYPVLRLIPEVDDLVRDRNLARLRYPDRTRRRRRYVTREGRRNPVFPSPWSRQVLIERVAQRGSARARALCVPMRAHVSCWAQPKQDTKHLPDSAKTRFASRPPNDCWTSEAKTR